MKPNASLGADERLAGDLGEAAAFGLAALVGVLSVAHTFVAAPVRFTALITEDSWFEYGAAVALATAALILLATALSPGPRGRRILFAICCGAALFVAGEELSWGQRILGLATPQPYAELNLQGETTVHNLAALDFLNSRLHWVLGWVLLFWAAACGFLRIARPLGFEAVRAAGVPVIPMELVPVFLVVPYYVLAWPVAKSDEVAEFFGALAVVLWAAGSALRFGPLRVERRTMKLGAMAATIIVVGGVTAVLTLWQYPPRSFTHRLNLTASRDYPARGMYEQAQTLYQYIYDHPRHLTRDTRIEHGRLLLAVGETAAARRVLEEALAEIEAGTPGPEANVRSATARGLLEQAR